MSRKYWVNSYDDILERIRILRKKFEVEIGQSAKPTSKDLELINEKKIKPPCEYCGKFSCYGDCA
jgi:hypothetical protein